jgi:hypothetical protein
MRWQIEVLWEKGRAGGGGGEADPSRSLRMTTGCGLAECIGILPLHFVQGQNDSEEGFAGRCPGDSKSDDPQACDIVRGGASV